MPEWLRDEAEYRVKLPGNTHETVVSVIGVMDASESERPKLFLENHADNRGLSVEDSPEARDAIIKSLSAAMKIAPEEADWYTRGEDNELMSVKIGYETQVRENPSYSTHLKNGDFADREAKDAKQFFPDVTYSELKTEAFPATQVQSTELAEAFSNAENVHNINLDFQPLTSCHEYNLSEHSIYQER